MFFIARPINAAPIAVFCNTPMIISGVCGLLVGIGIGIGFGSLIFNPFYSDSLGGGIWFGKKRRKRDIKEHHIRETDNYTWQMNPEHGLMLEKIEQAKQLYDNK